MLAAGKGPDGVGDGSQPGSGPLTLEWDDEEIPTSPGTPSPAAPSPRESAVDEYSLEHTSGTKPVVHRPDSFPSSYEKNLRHAIARLVGTPSGHEISIQGITDLRSQNGANAYISLESGKPPRIAGYIYDIVDLLYDILSRFDDSVERGHGYYSPATIVRDLELTEAQSGEFTNASKTVTARWNRVFDTAFYQIELRISSPQSEASLKPFLDRFAALQTFQIMSTTDSPVSLAGIRERLGHLLVLAKAENIVQMLRETDPSRDLINLGVPRGSGLFVRDADVGIGIRDRSVVSVRFDFNQGDPDDDIGGINSFNRSTWDATLLPNRSVFKWVVKDTDPKHAKNADWRDPRSLPLRRLVRDIWGGGVAHVNADMEDVPIDYSGGTPPAKIGGFSPSGETPGGELSGPTLRAPVQGASMMFLNPGLSRVPVFNRLIAGGMGAAALGGVASCDFGTVALL